MIKQIGFLMTLDYSHSSTDGENRLLEKHCSDNQGKRWVQFHVEIFPKEEDIRK